MGIIFDLDQTLIDTMVAESKRENRDWRSVYSLIPKFIIYSGINEALFHIHKKDIQVIIVTSSPKKYCTEIINYWNISVKHTVCYHDTVKRKPHPDPILKAQQLFEIPFEPTLSFGDKWSDVVASNEAGVISIACLWGADDEKSLLKSNPKHVINKPIEIIKIVDEYF